MHSPQGLFITGTDTGVGKTFVASLIAKALRATGRRVGVYKPAASGCIRNGNTLVSEDAVSLWNAAGNPGELERVCPQRFLAPLSPHLAAQAEGKELDIGLLCDGITYWRRRSDIVLVEGAGGLMSPMGEKEYVADLADTFGYPLIIVTRNMLGTINQTLQTLITAAVFHEGLPTAGLVLNHTASPTTDDVSMATNRAEIACRCIPPILAEVFWNAQDFDAQVDWFSLAK
jgi:dethiobiotin synthetase